MRKNLSLKKAIAYSAVVFAGTLFYGCGIQCKTKYIVNPDMTAKCVLEEREGLDVAVITSTYGGNNSTGGGTDIFSSMGGKDTTMPSTHDILLGFVSKILSNKGVETWKDISFGMIGKDTVYFKGTAYFKDISVAGFSAVDSDMHIFKNDKGQMVIEMKQSKKDTALTSTGSMYKNMFKGGTYYYTMHYYMAMFFKDFNLSMTYQVPGKIVSCSNFTKINDYTAEFAFNGRSMISSLDTLMQNTDMMSKVYSSPSGTNALANSSSFLFGEGKPIQIIYESGNKPQFDFAKEVAEAKKQYADFRRKSGLETFDSLALAKKQKAEEETRKMEGTLVLTAADSAHGKVYFKSLRAKQYYRNYIDFTGILSRPVNTGYSSLVVITSAKTDNGMNVLDSIKNHEYISAYMTLSSGNYSDSTISYTDKASFTMTTTMSADCKFINLEGKLQVDSVTSIPFKIVNLYLSTKTITDGEDYGGEK